MGASSSSIVVKGESVVAANSCSSHNNNHHLQHNHHHQQHQQHHHHHHHHHHPTSASSSAAAAALKAIHPFHKSSMPSSSSTVEHLCALGREKKRKVSGFATLRKKLIRRRRTSRSFDHAKVMREFVSGWGVWELNALVEEYEAAAALKDLVVQANLARPPAATFKQDLAELYNYKYCTDVDLMFRGACFPVHRALLSARCSFFRDLLAKVPGYGAQVTVDLRPSNFPFGVDIPTFSALLRYLYTGDFHLTDTRLDNLDALIRLGEEFGTPNPLEQDLKYLLETGEYSDCVLVFSASQDLVTVVAAAAAAASANGQTTADKSGSANNAASSSSSSASSSSSSTSGITIGSNGVGSEYGFTSRKLELHCHKAILSARSPFFRNLIQRRARAGEEMTERALRAPTQIVLDDSVIPWQYARVLLHAVYLDSVDMGCILRGSTSSSSLNEVKAMVAGKGGHMAFVEEAMEIYQIGRFLELDILVQGSEDIISESLTPENLVPILRWSEQPHGSAWVHRQALHFLREEFQPIVNSQVLYDLDKSHMMDALQSDFLQSSELDVLQAVLKWGEHQLTRRMEEREPNILSHTAHSVTKKGVKKRDLNDVELRDILSELLPLVRVDHVLPPNNEVLSGGIKRGLVSTPPSHMIGDDANNAVSYRISAWVCSKNNGLYVKPRLFTPYAEEVKALLDDHALQEMELTRSRTVRMSHIPDTLYMVDGKPPVPRPPPCAAHHNQATSPYSSGLDIVAGAVPIPDVETMQAMLRREQELRQSPSVQRAYALPLSNRWDITRQIQLRVVREFNLPDAVAEVLHSASHYCAYGDISEQAADIESRNVVLVGGGSQPDSSLVSSLVRQKPVSNHCSRPRVLSSYFRDPLPFISDVDPFRATEQTENSSCTEGGHVSDIMPDIAMATASFNQLHLHEGEMELDLGDGTNHSCSTGPMYL